MQCFTMVNADPEVLFQHGDKPFELRPDTKNGIWLMFLVPLAVLRSGIVNWEILTETYKLVGAFCLGNGVFVTIFLYLSLKTKFKVLSLAVVCNLVAAAVLFIFLQRGILFSLYSAVFCTIGFYRVFIYLLITFPKSFTIGEASVVGQGISILCYSASIHVYNGSQNGVHKNLQSCTLILQMGLLCIFVIGFLLFSFRIKNPFAVYGIIFASILIIVYLPLTFFLRKNPFFWIFHFIVGNNFTIKLLLYWVICVCIAFLAINSQIKKSEKATTSTRKIFHALACLIFLPGLLYDCAFTYLASGVALGILCILEILRVQNVPPLGNFLQDGFSAFVDEKDGGVLALTPIYLLSGCALPMWIHPSPCDITNTAIFNIIPILSGILTVGIGDAAASVIGSKFGTHFWAGTSRTIEGTLAYVLSQIIFLTVLWTSAIIYPVPITISLILKTIFGLLLTAFIEAKTDQVDNLVLPLVMYIIVL